MLSLEVKELLLDGADEVVSVILEGISMLLEVSVALVTADVELGI